MKIKLMFLLVIVFTCILIPFQASVIYATSISRVQGYCRGIGTSSPINLNMTNTPVSGHILVAVIGIWAGSGSIWPSVINITESSVTWSRQVYKHDPNYLLDIEIWGGVVHSGASKRISVFFNGSYPVAVADICEYSGLLVSNCLDKTATNYGAITSGYPGATDTGTTNMTTQSYELWVGGVICLYQGSNYQTSPTNGFVMLDGQGFDSLISLSYLEKVVMSNGSADSGTSGVGDWSGSIATFKAYISPSVSVLPSAKQIASGSFAYLTSSTSGGVSPYTYQWYNNNTAISGAISANYNYTNAVLGTHMFDVKVTDSYNNTVISNNSTIAVTSSVVTLTIYTPLSKTYSLNSIILNFTAATTDTAISKKWYNFKANSTWLYSQNQTYTTPINITLTNGVYILSTYANDSAHNVGSLTEPFAINVALPPQYGGWNNGQGQGQKNSTKTNSTGQQVPEYSGQTLLIDIGIVTIVILIVAVTAYGSTRKKTVKQLWQDFLE